VSESNSESVKEAATVVTGIEAFIDRARQMAEAAHLDVALLSHGLDVRVFGDEQFVDKLQALVLRQERSQLRILVNAPELAMRKAHRLVELGRRVSSRIHFRQLADDQKGVIEEYLIVDEKQLLQRDAADQLEARYYAYAPLAARQRQQTFNALWDAALPAQEFRELRL